MITTYGGIIGDNNASGTIQCNSNTNEADISISFPIPNGNRECMYVGGISGNMNSYSEICGNSNSGDINITDFTYVGHVGGIVGQGGVNAFSDNKNEANIKILNNLGTQNLLDFVGGLVGNCSFSQVQQEKTIRGCHSIGNITTTVQKDKIDCVGGLFGEISLNDKISIVDCYHIGDIKVSCIDRSKSRRPYGLLWQW